MKKRWKLYGRAIILLIVIVGLLYTCGMHTRFFINHTHGKIKAGQSIDQVVRILNAAFEKPRLCCWNIGNAEPICNDAAKCSFPGDIETSKDLQLQVLYMGFGYTHIEYEVDFNESGKVTTITEIKMWD
jgi:hypothetical protein